MMGKYQPALLGGLFIGVLSILPIVNIANCCCLWVILGGVLTVYLQQQRTPEPLETADAVLGGLLAGAIGAIIWMIAQSVIIQVTGVLWQDEVRRAIEGSSEIPPEVRDGLIRMIAGPAILGLIIVVVLPLYAVFSMLGALLGLAFFRKKTPPVVQG